MHRQFLQIRSIILILFGLFFPYRTDAQKKVAANFVKLTQQNGLPSYNIKKTISDKKGFVWIATQEGLSRYDSKAIIKYKEGLGKHGITGNDIWDIKEDTSNNLIWVAGYNSIDAVDIITGKVKKTLSSEFKDTWIKCILLDKKRILIGTFNGLFIYDIKTKKIAENRTRLFSPVLNSKINISSIVKDKFDRVWIFSPDYGIAIMASDGSTVVKTMTLADLKFTEKQDNRLPNRLLNTRTGKILLGAGQGLRIFNLFADNTIICERAFPKIKIDEPVYTFDFDNENNLWFANSEALYRYNEDSNEIIQYEDNEKGDGDNWLNSVFDIRIDSENVMWLSTQKGLAYFRINDKPLMPYYRSSNSKNKISHAYYIYPENDSNLFVCAEDGLYKFNILRQQILKLSGQETFFYVFKAMDGTLIASSKKQLYYLKGEKPDKIENRYKELSVISKESVNSSLVLSDSLVIMGSESLKGIFLWNYKKHTLRIINSSSRNEKLPSDIVNYVVKTKEGNVAVLSDNYLSILKPDGRIIKNYSFKEKGSKEELTFLFDLIRLGDKYYLAIYGKGIFCLNAQFKIERKYSEADGLCNSGVYKMFNVGDSALYITTNNGLSVFNSKTETFKNYYQSDGLHSNAFEEACGIMRNELIYAGGVNGFTVIDPAKFTTNTRPPKTYINRVFVEANSESTDTTNIELQKLTIPDDVLQTTLYFSGINWSNPERTTFAWRIIERSKEWSNIGAQNFINLIGLEHGTYRFQVKAANEDGVWSEHKELILVFLPKWHQTWWFKFLIILTASGVIYAFYRYRITQIKKQHEIRKNIATDLHDDLGSTLNSVKVFTNLAISGIKKEESLQQIKDNLTEATAGLRDMIWVLDDSLDTVDELVTRLKQFAIPVAAASNIVANINCETEINNRQLTKEEKRNLFLVCKEAINNSIKYSEASQIAVSIVPEGRKIKIIINDNGKGFNVDDVKKGYGLKNMQYRAGQVKYKVLLTSEPGNGAQIVIIPA